MNPDRLAQLEEERAFLLGSIRDLDREHEVGDVDDADYQTVRDGYVARAAAVLRDRNAAPAEEYTIVRPDRSTARVEITASYVKYERQPAIQAIIRDITPGMKPRPRCAKPAAACATFTTRRKTRLCTPS